MRPAWIAPDCLSNPFLFSLLRAPITLKVFQCLEPKIPSLISYFSDKLPRCSYTAPSICVFQTPPWADSSLFSFSDFFSDATYSWWPSKSELSSLSMSFLCDLKVPMARILQNYHLSDHFSKAMSTMK
jgi:hypothetical protein